MRRTVEAYAAGRTDEATGGGGAEPEAIGGGGADGEAIGGGGADGRAIGGGAAEGDARGGGGAEYAALGIAGGLESRFSAASGADSRSSVAGGIGEGKPIKVWERWRIGGTLPSRASVFSAGGGEANGDVVPSAGGSSGATEAVGEVAASAKGGSGDSSQAEGSDCAAAARAGRTADTSMGCCMTRVTSLVSSQSVSMSSVDGGVDGSAAGASLVRRGGTEDDRP